MNTDNAQLSEANAVAQMQGRLSKHREFLFDTMQSNIERNHGDLKQSFYGVLDGNVHPEDHTNLMKLHYQDFIDAVHNFGCLLETAEEVFGVLLRKHRDKLSEYHGLVWDLEHPKKAESELARNFIATVTEEAQHLIQRRLQDILGDGYAPFLEQTYQLGLDIGESIALSFQDRVEDRG